MQKNRSVHDAISNLQWVSNLYADNFTIEHIKQFITPWASCRTWLLIAVDVSFIWTLIANGQYSGNLAYTAQFLSSSIACSIKGIAWKISAPPKCHIFTYVATQNCLWSSDHLVINGWPHHHTSKRIWSVVVSWLSIPSFVQCLRSNQQPMLQYWLAISMTPSSSPKGLLLDITVIIWELWKGL
jgi:hypothetical protein